MQVQSLQITCSLKFCVAMVFKSVRILSPWLGHKQLALCKTLSGHDQLTLMAGTYSFRCSSKLFLVMQGCLAFWEYWWYFSSMAPQIWYSSALRFWEFVLHDHIRAVMACPFLSQSFRNSEIGILLGVFHEGRHKFIEVCRIN